MFVQPSATLISRKAFESVGGFDERLCGYEDDDLFLRMFCAGYDNFYLDMPLSKWRIYPGSTSYTPHMMRSRAIYTRKLLAMFLDDPNRGRYYARDLIIPRFREHAIREFDDAVKSDNAATVSEALAEIRFLAQHDKSILDSLYHHTLVYYRNALIGGDIESIDAAWVMMAKVAAEMPNGRLRTRVTVNMLRNAWVSRNVFALRRLAKPAIRWAFSA
jgi:hypothetical protein